MRSTILPLLLSGAVAACARSAEGGGEEEPALAARQATGVEWSLVELNGAPAPLGAGDRPATLTLGDSARASGFAGCNGIAGSYELAGESLRFGPLVSTEMACDQGMELEQAYGAALEATRAMRVTKAGLELLGADGVVARFRANP